MGLNATLIITSVAQTADQPHWKTMNTGGIRLSSNLPPGVTESMLPGNRPEDEAWLYYWEQTDRPGIIYEQVTGKAYVDGESPVLDQFEEDNAEYRKAIERDFQEWLNGGVE